MSFILKSGKKGCQLNENDSRGAVDHAAPAGIQTLQKNVVSPLPTAGWANV